MNNGNNEDQNKIRRKKVSSSNLFIFIYILQKCGFICYNIALSKEV